MTKMLRFLAPYRKRIAAMLFLLLLQVAGTFFIPAMTADIINHGILTGDLDYVLLTGGRMILTAVLVTAIAVSAAYLSASNSALIGRDIRNALFSKVQSLSVNEFNRFGTASMITRNTNDVIQVQQAFSALTEMLLPAPVMAVTGLVLAFSKDRVLALAIVGVMVLVTFLSVTVSKKVLPLFETLQTLMDGINRKLRETIIGVRVIRAFERTEYEKLKVNDTFQEYGSLAIRINKMFAVLLPAITLIMNLCTLLIVALGGWRMAGGWVQVGDIMAVVEYGMLILSGLIMGIMAFVMIPRAKISVDRILAVLEAEPETAARAGEDSQKDGPKDSLEGGSEDDPEDSREHGPEDSQEHAPAKIEFRGVTFGYYGAEEDVLHDISFSVNAGETTAIIGGTGSGKSTVVNLMMGFYEAQEGDILVDGRDIKTMSKQKLRQKIGYVPQKAFLFSGTIADNFRHGKDDATEEEMMCAAKTAQIDGLIGSLEEGLSAPVSQAGNNFSGGQRQRLAIARALVKKPEIYLFDDSFSALDYKTDAKLRAALREEVKDSAVIIVAQRISTILDADQIIVMDEGRVAGIGNHRELLRDCGVYQQIARSQLSEEELA